MPAAAGGLAVAEAGVIAATGGALLMGNGANNASKGYNYGTNSSEKNTNKGTLSGTKAAVKKAQEKVGGSLPKGQSGKKGSPQRGDSKKGYRLDPVHPNRPAGDPESGPHVNWWNYMKGKRGAGGESGAIPIE